MVKFRISKATLTATIFFTLGILRGGVFDPMPATAESLTGSWNNDAGTRTTIHCINDGSTDEALIARFFGIESGQLESRSFDVIAKSSLRISSPPISPGFGTYVIDGPSTDVRCWSEFRGARGARMVVFDEVQSLAGYASYRNAILRGRRSKSRSVSSKRKRPQCNDHRDNDGDGKIDFPRDKSCRSRSGRSEGKPHQKPGSGPGSAGTLPSNPGSLGVGASLGARLPFPADNEWNRDVSGDPVDPDSARIIATTNPSTGLHPDFGTVWEGAPIGIPYVVVAGSQPKVGVTFDYSAESDAGPYPIPDDAPVEGGSSSTGDRHVLIIDRDSWKLYELFGAYNTTSGWHAGSGAIFDLSSNSLRPRGWTSADAAGLPIFPGLVRYDEVVEQGEIRHALRFTVQRTRHAFVEPARHYASSANDPALPPMGMRVRLKASVDIAGYPTEVQVILKAMKKYGMIVADNGSNWFVSGAPDGRWNDERLHSLGAIKGNDFEVVKMGTVVTNVR